MAAEIAEIDGVTDEGVLSRPTPRPRSPHRARRSRPLVVRGRRGRPTSTSRSTSARAAGRRSRRRRQGPRDRRHRRRRRLRLGLRRPGLRLLRVVRELPGRADPDHVPRGDPDPADHLPQPDPVVAADHLRAVVSILDRDGRGLPARQVRRPDGQRPDASTSSTSWSSAPAPTTRCCWSPDIARSCAGTRTGTRRWRSPCTARRPPSSPAPRPSSSGLLCLVLADLNSTAGMGPALAVGVGVTVLSWSRSCPRCW